MRTDLRVPFAEKDEAKRLGARWDAARKVWYCRTRPTSPPSRAGCRRRPMRLRLRRGPVATRAQAASAKTGERYFALSCDCLPWEGCATRAAAVEARGWRVTDRHIGAIQ